MSVRQKVLALIVLILLMVGAYSTVWGIQRCLTVQCMTNGAGDIFKTAPPVTP